jgi:hypothetical protein
MYKKIEPDPGLNIHNIDNIKDIKPMVWIKFTFKNCPNLIELESPVTKAIRIELVKKMSTTTHVSPAAKKI